MASLLRLYQRDVEAQTPELAIVPPSIVAWVEATKHYLDQLRSKYDQIEDVSGKQKKLAASGLNLAAQSFQIGVSTCDDLQALTFKDVHSDREPSVRRFVSIVTLMLLLLLLNLWFMSVIGVFSVFVLMSVTVLLGWSDIGLIERRLRSFGKSKQNSTARLSDAANPQALPFKVHIESMVRRVDDMIEIDAPATSGLPPALSLKTETLEFIQDMLEAKLADDKDFAFKKISRTLLQVLSSEGIEVVTDVENHLSMFNIDMVMDELKAQRTETIRPALVKDGQCLLAGYAQQFVHG